MAHFVPLGHPYTTLTITQAFFDHIVKLHGFPCSIVSDRDPSSPAYCGRSSLRSLVSSCASARRFVHRRTDSPR
jgi:hypothetical protein